jgi:hypothetical protein
MPRGPKGEKRPADVIGNAVHVMRIATGEAEDVISPAMASGLSATLWSMTDMADMIDAAQPKPGKRGPYKKTGAEISN